MSDRESFACSSLPSWGQRRVHGDSPAEFEGEGEKCRQEKRREERRKERKEKGKALSAIKNIINFLADKIGCKDRQALSNNVKVLKELRCIMYQRTCISEGDAVTKWQIIG